METDIMIAYCGLNCAGCPVHLATLEPDESQKQVMRNSIAKLCMEQYGMELNPEDITDCDGCRVDKGRLFSGCCKCEIKKCAIEKDIESCAFCPDYACDKLKDMFTKEHNAQSMLEEIRNKNKL